MHVEPDSAPYDPASTPSEADPLADGRYALGAEVAPGVHAAKDLRLERAVTVQTADQAVADQLEGEARLLARVDHLGVPGLLDFARDATGARMVLRQVEGITLAEAIARAAAGKPPPELSHPIAVVRLMLRVCETLGAAHERGVTHGHLAPESILLGAHGQVIVQAWSMGAPAESGVFQDIQAVGACMFQALALRPPRAEGRDPLGALDEAELRRLPGPVLAVIRRAMLSDAARGYGAISALIDDLERVLEGQAPAAYRQGWLRRSLGWHRANLLLVVLVPLLLIAAGAIWGPRLIERQAWGEPVLEETFSDSSYKNRWLEPSFSGMFQVQKGRLVSIAPRGADLIHRERLATPLAIEYTGQIQDGSTPCDLSVTWRERSLEPSDGLVLAGGGRNLSMQFGGMSNTCMFISSASHKLPVAYSPERLEPGRTYRFRVEIEEATVSMFIDGRRILHYRDLSPFLAGHIALYAHFPGKAFDDVRIYQKQAPAEPSPLSLGDTYLANGKYEEALPMYARLAETYAGRPYGQQAQFRKGVAEWSLGRREDALTTWSSITAPDLLAQVESYAVQLQDEPQQTAFCGRFIARYRGEPAKREGMLAQWNAIMQRLAADPLVDQAVIDRFLSIRSEAFPDEPMPAYIAARALLAQRRFTDCIRLFPDDRSARSSALLALGRTQEVIEADWAPGDARNRAWQMNGDFAKVIADREVIPIWKVMTLCMLDRGAEALGDPEFRYPVLLHLGRAEELLAARTLPPQAVNDALISLGRLAEAAGGGLPRFPGSGHDAVALLLLDDLAGAERGGRVPRHAYRFMQAAERGDAAALAVQGPLVTLPDDLRGFGGWFTSVIVRPLVAHWRGDGAALEQQIRPQLDVLSGVYGKRAWYLGLAVLGEITPEEVATMPAVSEAPAWAALARGIRAELSGQPGEAVVAYEAFTAMPWHHRLLLLHTPDPEVEWFVRWRLRALRR
jgi:hypothetical protein